MAATQTGTRKAGATRDAGGTRDDSSGATAVSDRRPVPRLKQRYADEIASTLREEFGYANVMQVPTLTKIVVNMGVGEAARDAKLIEGAVRDLSTITGQRPTAARAKKT